MPPHSGPSRRSGAPTGNPPSPGRDTTFSGGSGGDFGGIAPGGYEPGYLAPPGVRRHGTLSTTMPERFVDPYALPDPININNLSPEGRMHELGRREAGDRVLSEMARNAVSRSFRNANMDELRASAARSVRLDLAGASGAVGTDGAVTPGSPGESPRIRFPSRTTDEASFHNGFRPIDVPGIMRRTRSYGIPGTAADRPGAIAEADRFIQDITGHPDPSTNRGGIGAPTTLEEITRVRGRGDLARMRQSGIDEELVEGLASDLLAVVERRRLEEVERRRAAGEQDPVVTSGVQFVTREDIVRVLTGAPFDGPVIPDGDGGYVAARRVGVPALSPRDVQRVFEAADRQYRNSNGGMPLRFERHHDHESDSPVLIPRSNDVHGVDEFRRILTTHGSQVGIAAHQLASAQTDLNQGQVLAIFANGTYSASQVSTAEQLAVHMREGELPLAPDGRRMLESIRTYGVDASGDARRLRALLEEAERRTEEGEEQSEGDHEQIRTILSRYDAHAFARLEQAYFFQVNHRHPDGGGGRTLAGDIRSCLADAPDLCDELLAIRGIPQVAGPHGPEDATLRVPGTDRDIVAPARGNNPRQIIRYLERDDGLVARSESREARSPEQQREYERTVATTSALLEGINPQFGPSVYAAGQPSYWNRVFVALRRGGVSTDRLAGMGDNLYGASAAEHVDALEDSVNRARHRLECIELDDTLTEDEAREHRRLAMEELLTEFDDILGERTDLERSVIYRRLATRGIDLRTRDLPDELMENEDQWNRLTATLGRTIY